MLLVTGSWFLVLIKEHKQQATSNKQLAPSNKTTLKI